MQIQVFEPKDKQKQVLELLKFDTIMVFIDARNENVKVPESLKAQFDLRLNFNYEFGINDFRVLPDRIEASLSFAEGEFFCVIPFEAVYLILCQAVNQPLLRQRKKNQQRKKPQHQNLKMLKLTANPKLAKAILDW